jgi:hypothetical protein
MNKPWTNVALFEDLNSARVLQEYLQKKGVESRVFNDRLQQLLLFLCPPHLTCRVQVHGNFHHFAADLLEKNPPEILERAIHCPNCTSLNLNYPQMTRKFTTPTILLHLGILFRVIDHQCYCENCHWMWALPRRRIAAPAEASAAGHVH